MAYLLVHHEVEDFDKWKHNFNAHAYARSETGSKGGKVFRNADNPNEVFVLLEWDSLENAKSFGKSENIKEIMKNAGVTGIPAIYYLEESAKTST